MTPIMILGMPVLKVMIGLMFVAFALWIWAAITEDDS